MGKNTTQIELILQDGQVIAASSRINAALEGIEGRAKKIGDSKGFDKFAENVKAFLEDPLGKVGAAADAVLKKLGPVGSAVAGAGVGIAAFGKVAFDAADSLAKYGDRLGDTATRMGLTVKETVQFSFAMRAAGGDISSLEATMRKLSQGLSDGSEEGKRSREGLRALGIVTRELDGSARPMSKVMLDLSAALGQIQNPADRNAKAIQIMGRSALEALPDLLELSQGVQRAKQLGLGPTDAELQKWAGYQRKIAEVETQWEALKRAVKEPIAATIIQVIKTVTDGGDKVTYTLDKDGRLVQKTGPGAPGANNLAVIRGKGPQYSEADAYRLGLIPKESAASVMVGNVLGALDAGAGERVRRASEASFGQTAIGAEYQLQKLKQKADELRNAYFGMEGAGKEATEKKRSEWQAAEAALRNQVELVKALTKEEGIRVSNLEKMRELSAQGEGYYVIGSGRLQTVVGTEALAAPNIRPRRLPSMYRRGEYNPAVEENGAPYPMTPGVQPGGFFVVDEAEAGRANAPTQQAYASIAKAQLEGVAGRSATDLQSYLATLNLETSATARIIELRAGPGGEYAAAVKSAAVRKAALDDEFQRTGDIVRYRQESAALELDLQVRAAEIERGRVETVRNLGSSFFSAMLHGQGGQFARSSIEGVGSQMFGNVAAMGTKALYNALPKASSPDSFMGKLLAGTPFAADPLKLATDANTIATLENTMALRAIAMSGSSGGGGTFNAAADLLRLGVRAPGAGIPGASGSGGEENAYPGEMPNATSAGGGSSRAQTALRYGAAAIGAGYGIYGMATSGSTKGKVASAGATLTSIGAMVPGPAGWVMMGAGMATSLVSSLFGDPKQQYAERLNRDLDAARYTAPTGRDYSYDLRGRGFDREIGGGYRVVVQQTNYFSAIDAKSLQERGPEFARATMQAVQGGQDGGFVDAMRDRLLPQ